MRLAVVTPLDAAQTGVADYSRDLLPFLAEAVGRDIHVFTDRASLGQSGVGWSVGPIDELPLAARTFDLIIYQLGNSPAHDFMAEAARDYPGLIVLHDISLHYFFARQTRSRYLQAMGYGYGTAGTALGRRFLQEFVSVNYPAYLVSEAVVDRSLGTIVHSRHAFDLLQLRCPNARLYQVPMPVPLPPDRPPATARAQLHLNGADFLIGVFGVLNDSKQPQAILTAMRRLLDEGMPVKAVFIGRENDSVHLANEAQHLGLSDQIISLGFVDDLTVINNWLVACDVAINLRAPYWGETSASTLRILAAGVPVVVNRVGAFAELPDEACIKLPPAGPDLSRQLTDALRDLYIRAEQRVSMRLAARQYIAVEHEPSRVAIRYLDAVRSILEAA